ncbi:MAG: FKBP-type peptidyl-prolyl cis-trans isomerase [Steroidobacteraceae bacterium]
MSSRIPVAIAILAAGTLGIATAGAQESGAPAPSTHAHAGASQRAAPTSSRAGASKSQLSYSLGLLLGSRLPQLGLEEKTLDFQQVERGLKEVVSGKVHPSATDEHNVQALIKQSQSGTGQKNEAASHSLGLLLGARLPQLGLDDKALDFRQVARGLQDVMSGKGHASTADEQSVQQLVLQKHNAMAQKNEAAAHRFLAANGKRAGVKTTHSGLQYKVLNAGSGASPQPTDQVTVNYSGTLLDGTVFDSTYQRGMPYTYPLSQRMIPGWQEALAMMKPGAKWQIFIPPELGYGVNPPPPIPPNSVLKFDIELLKVAPAAASPAGAGPNIGGGAGH